MKLPLTLLCAAAGAFVCFGGGTRSWDQDSQGGFEKGTRKKISLRSDGRLMLAPEFREIFDASTVYLWAVAEDRKGNVYFGGGGLDPAKSKLFVVEGGKGRVLCEVPGVEIHAIAVDAQDRVYVATSPDGKVYRVGSDGKPVEFYDPKAKYIWGLAFNAAGELFVATGDKGEVHKVGANGTGSVYFRTEETHARSIAVDRSNGNLYVGTEPDGLVMRVNTAGEGFVLYQSPKREVTALALDPKGLLYAAAVGNRSAQAPAPAAPAPAPAPAAPAAAAPGTITVGAPARAPAPPPSANPTAAVSGGSEVFRIEADGYPRKLWEHANEIAYTLGFDGQGHALVGTGNNGNIYRLDSDLNYTLLLNATTTQVTGIAQGQGGKIWVVTGNIGKLYQLGSGVEQEGTFESQVMDAGVFTRWGRINFEGKLPAGSVAVATRSGNLDPPAKNWSPWQETTLNGDGGRIASPAARFLQYRLTLKATGPAERPEVSEVGIAYLPRNVAPVIQKIEVTPANYRYPPQSLTLTQSSNLTLPALGQARRASPTFSAGDNGSVTLVYAKGYIGARWLAKDENDDGLEAKVEIRGIQETGWKLIKDKLREKIVSWDSTAFSDGLYLLRVTTSDSPSNPPDQALEATLESDSFIIDNTPPRIAGLAGTRTGGRIEGRWHAEDALNVLKRAEYSVDGGDWAQVEPTTRVTDSQAHDYVLRIDNIGQAEHTIAIRVTDAYDNQAVEKIVVK